MSSRFSPSRGTLSSILLVTACLSACHPSPPSSAVRPETPAECAARRQDLGAFVARLPTESVPLPTRVELPISTIGGVPGDGPLVEISETEVSMGEKRARDVQLEARVAAFRNWILALPATDHPVLYVAAAGDLDVRTLRAFLEAVPGIVELRLLVRMPALGSAPGESTARARDLAAHLLVERDPARRLEIVEDGIGEFARCGALSAAVSSTGHQDPASRWPALQSAIETALPSCDCAALDTASLGLLIGADRRGGAGSLAWLPLSFLRDDRCDATMPLRSLKKLISQIETFDAQFSGAFENDAMKFGDVVDNDRLRVYFCDALPGETLAAKERARSTLFLRAPSGCQGWSFEPLAPGSPMGTMRRASPSSPALAFHYRQASEQLRMFGPVDPASPSKPTDERDFPCDETFRLIGVDEHSITFDKGGWFYDERACAAGGAATFGGSGCVAQRISGEPPPSDKPALK